MLKTKANIKPKILVWARKEAGLELEEAARKAAVNVDRLQEWERGDDQPSIPQLRKLADAYKRPITVFYLQDVPERFRVMHDFRRLPGEVAGEYSMDLRLQLRLIEQRRELALELLQEVGEAPIKFKPQITMDENPAHVGQMIRKWLGVTLAEQQQWHDPRVGFNVWRARMEAIGVLVFQFTNVDVKEARGLSIADDYLPVAAVNKKDAFNGRIFSLLHEFTHLLLRKSSLCDMDDEAERSREDKQVEVFCNRVAAEALVPSGDFLADDIVASYGVAPQTWADDDLQEVAKRFCVSREVVTRSLLTYGRVTEQFYRQKRAQFVDEYREGAERQRASQSLKTFRRNRPQEVLSEYGKPFVNLVFDSYHQRRITLNDVSAYFDLALKNIPKIQQKIGVV